MFTADPAAEPSTSQAIVPASRSTLIPTILLFPIVLEIPLWTTLSSTLISPPKLSIPFHLVSFFLFKLVIPQRPLAKVVKTTSAYHLPLVGISNVENPNSLTDNEKSKFPFVESSKWVSYPARGFKVLKLFVGVSSKESLPVPALTEKLLGVQLFPLPLVSFPNVVAVVFELSANCNLKPFVPKVKELVS